MALAVLPFTWARLREVADVTPPERDRVVDASRAGAIMVVIAWHWSGSLTHRDAEGTVVMPNPIGDVPGGWAATWLLQVMPVFFVVGGFANLTGWVRVRRGGGGAAVFLRRRMGRLVPQVGLWVAAWLAVEVVVAALVENHRPLWEWFPGMLVPLWFLAVYAAVTALVPLTARMHHRSGGWAVLGLSAAVAVSEFLARGMGVAWVGWVSAGLVWLVVHQLGYLWRTDAGGWGTGRRAGLAVAGLGGLVLLTTVLGYPRSMVALTGAAESNMFPPNAAIVALAVFQLGVLLLAAPVADRLLRRPGPWRAVVAVNAVALPLFVWHMTAYLVFLWIFEHLGGVPADQPTLQWWLQRPLWLAGPGLVLAALVTLLGRTATPTLR